MMGRKPLSAREYGSLQALFGMVSTFSAGLDDIRKRAEGAECWEDMQTIEKLSGGCLDSILATVPENKLRHIRQDLGNMKLKFHLEPPGLASYRDEQFSYTPTRVLNELLNHLCQSECVLCSKTSTESRKCKWRKLLEEALPHEINGTDREFCKYADLVLGLEEL